jgi:hypothetical protein
VIPSDLHDKLTRERDALIRVISWDWQELEKKLARAFEERAAGNHPEARILMNEALDLECAVTGDCVVLSDLSEEWGVDYERDQR